MKRVIIAIAILLLFQGCHTDKTAEKLGIDTNLALNDSTSVSQKYLHEKRFGRFNFKTEEQWDSLNGNANKKLRHKKHTIKPNVRTFGWHLYSNGSLWKNYNFSMLWGISYFSYSIQPKTGHYKSIHQWKTTALIDSAKASNCKVFLSVSNFGSANNTTFLNNPKAHHTLIDSLSYLLALRSADGINIDFEGVSKKDKNRFTDFIITISKRLKQKNPNYKIVLCLYAIDWNSIFDIQAIDSYVDFYTLMGYDYYGKFSKTTGPVTPFNSSKKFGRGLKSSVEYYLKKGVPPNKLIVGLPYYGAEWYTKNPQIGATALQFKSHPPYGTIRKFYVDALNIPVKFDTISASTYLIVETHNNSYQQLFFEDRKSLSIKYDWIKNTKLGGVGIWALGYDNGYSDLWDLLTEKFSETQNDSLYGNTLKNSTNQ